MRVKAAEVGIAAVVAAAPGAFLGTAAAQSLALSYALKPVNKPSDYTYSAAPPDPCAVLDGLSFAYPCWRARPMSMTESAEMAPKLAAAADSNTRVDAGIQRNPVDAFLVRIEAKPAATELPLLGSPSPTPTATRPSGGREALTSSPKTADLMLRVGSKYRLKSSDEGWELYKFSDSTYESRFRNTIKAIGIELLVPFQ